MGQSGASTGARTTSSALLRFGSVPAAAELDEVPVSHESQDVSSCGCAAGPLDELLAFCVVVWPHESDLQPRDKFSMAEVPLAEHGTVHCPRDL